MNPIDRVKSEPSKAVRVDYDNGSTEIIWFRNGFLFGLMDGKGPAPLDETDARTVCERYDSELIELEALTDNGGTSDGGQR